MNQILIKQIDENGKAVLKNMFDVNPTAPIAKLKTALGRLTAITFNTYIESQRVQKVFADISQEQGGQSNPSGSNCCCSCNNNIATDMDISQLLDDNFGKED